MFCAMGPSSVSREENFYMQDLSMHKWYGTWVGRALLCFAVCLILAITCL